MAKRTEIIQRFLLNGVKANNPQLIADAMETFAISRQAIHRHLQQLVEQGFLISDGHTKGRTYKLGVNRQHTAIYTLHGLQESDVYYRDFGIVFSDLPKNIENICHYGFTEILNNAIDHSEGSTVEIKTIRNKDSVLIGIEDNGEGIFKRITRLLNLSDPRESLLELSKGKLTTDPANHTGQGIFFTSRAFDKFFIISGDLAFSHTSDQTKDVLLHQKENQTGTYVMMEIDTTSPLILREIFDQFAPTDAENDYAFTKTVIPIRLALYEGETLLSRSQAKRILNRIEKFKDVVLDFEGIEEIGQAFSDEIFRVFVNKHPETKISFIHTNQNVLKMIKAAKANF